jgi:hypothetical protein
MNLSEAQWCETAAPFLDLRGEIYRSLVYYGYGQARFLFNVIPRSSISCSSILQLMQRRRFLSSARRPFVDSMLICYP